MPSFSAYEVDWLDDRPVNDETWSASDCVDALNLSPHLVAHDGHANETYALRMVNSDIDDLSNAEPFLLNSLGCYCGAFDDSDCFAEDLVKRNEYGAFAVLMNSRYGWFNSENEWMFSGEFMRCFFDELLVQGNDNIGVANQLGKHDMIGSVETAGSDMVYRWCYFEITLFGDPHTPLVGGDDLKVLPATDFNAAGPEGGPFTPFFQTYAVSAGRVYRANSIGSGAVMRSPIRFSSLHSCQTYSVRREARKCSTPDRQPAAHVSIASACNRISVERDHAG